MLARSVMSDSLQTPGPQPARLLCPWDFPGKNTGVGLVQGKMAASRWRSWDQICKALVWRPTKVHTRWLGLLCCRALRCRAYEWGMQKPETPPLDRVYKIPGLESITFMGNMHSMPRLARPVFPSWDPDWMHLLALLREHLLYKDQVCYIFHQCCRLLEGVKQALWLNKTKLIEGLPEKVPSLTGDPWDHTEDQDEPVLNAISHAHL